MRHRQATPTPEKATAERPVEGRPAFVTPRLTVASVSVRLLAHAEGSAVTNAEPVSDDAGDSGAAAGGSAVMDWPATGAAARSTSASGGTNGRCVKVPTDP